MVYNIYEKQWEEKGGSFSSYPRKSYNHEILKNFL